MSVRLDISQTWPPASACDGDGAGDGRRATPILLPSKSVQYCSYECRICSKKGTAQGMLTTPYNPSHTIPYNIPAKGGGAGTREISSPNVCV